MKRSFGEQDAEPFFFRARKRFKEQLNAADLHAELQIDIK